jgi:hypothetical protein
MSQHLKNVQETNVTDTEESKLPLDQDSHARHGIHKLHKHINTPLKNIQRQTRLRTIAEIPLIVKQFGAILPTALKDGSIVIQLR